MVFAYARANHAPLWAAGREWDKVREAALTGERVRCGV